MFSLIEILGTSTPEINLLDIGAMIEDEPRYAPIYHSGYAKLTLVEPNRESNEKLKKAFGDETRILNIFLGNGKKATIYVTYYPGCTSIFKPDPSVIDKFFSINTGPKSNFEVIKTETAKTVRLDDISPKTNYDYIKLDIQGSELMVLQNGIDSLKNTLVVESEAEFIPIYKDQPLFGDIQIFMQEQGFIFHKFIDIASRCFKPMSFSDNVCEGMSQLLWTDAIFIRDFKDLKNYADLDLIKTAYIMQDLYSSFDLVYFFLQEYDKRNQTPYALKYAKKLATFSEIPKHMLNLKEYV